MKLLISYLNSYEMNKEGEKNSKCGSFSLEESIFILFFILSFNWDLTQKPKHRSCNGDHGYI